MSLLPGQVLSFYEVLGPLGSGGMSEVFRARDTRLDREVALKVLPEHLADDEAALRRFEREARTLASLNHPNVAGIHGVDQVGEVCFLALELVPGEDLAQRVGRGPTPVEEALDIARQVAEGLAAAHRTGVVHRDLKPANVVLTPDGRAKVLDFGLAKRVAFEESTSRRSDADAGSRLTTEGTLVGTVDYMSPEQSRGREVDERTDRWAFGCLLFELLSGTRIFPASSVPDKLAAIAADEPDWGALPPATPAGVRALLERCLEKDPARRVTDLAEAARLLANAGRSPEPSGAASIAVLPFVNTSGRAEDEYFSDGITDEIQIALSALPGLRVAARTSSFAFKGRAVDVAEVGERLGVTRVLEGSVRRQGERVRIGVQLIDVEGGYQVWSKRFDCKLGNIFDLQDRLAAEVASALRLQLTGGAPQEPVGGLVTRRTNDLEAYDRYLQGRFLYQQRGSSLERAVQAFEGALELDPDLAAAHAGLAEARGLLSYYGSRRPSELMPLAREAAERALALDPDLAEAHTALAWVHLMYDWDDAAAAREFREALRLDPRSVQARLWYGGYNLGLLEGRHEEGIALCREATELDPLSGAAHAQLAVVQNFCGRSEDALATLRPLTESRSTSYVLWFQSGLAHSNLGNHEQARVDLEHAVSLSSMHAWAKGLLGATLAHLGERRAAEQVQAELLRASEEGFVSPFCLAHTPSALGEVDAAMTYLEACLAERDGLVRVVPVFRSLDPVREHARYGELRSAAGLAR